MPTQPVNTTLVAGGPRRAHKARAILGAMLIIPPLAWAAQLIVNYAVSSYACYPGASPRVAFLPGWSWVWSGALAFNLLTLALSIIIGSLALILWRKETAQATEAIDMLEGGHDNAQNLSAWATLVGALFFVAIAFDTLELLTVTQCGN